jgi:mannose-1-phosphate guanylyltransferase
MLNLNPVHDAQLSGELWGLVLAAGDGKRMEGFIRETRGLDLPKQYVNFVGQRSMLEHTYRRAERRIAAERILTIVAAHHLRHGEVRRQLSPRTSANVIVQPHNKETGPGIFLPLMHLYKRCPEAIVVVFPADHFILEEERFMDHVELAARAIHHDPSRIVLLAMEASIPEVEYGYIVPRAERDPLSLWGTYRAAKFIEKPPAPLAMELISAGGLWNTMIMVFKVHTLVQLLRRLFPAIYSLFAQVHEAIGTPAEAKTVEAVYKLLEPMNFSKDFLEKVTAAYPEAVSVLPVLQVFWSDLGSPRRIAQVRELLEQRAATDAARQREPTPARNPPQTAISRSTLTPRARLATL